MFHFKDVFHILILLFLLFFILVDDFWIAIGFVLIKISFWVCSLGKQLILASGWVFFACTRENCSLLFPLLSFFLLSQVRRARTLIFSCGVQFLLLFLIIYKWTPQQWLIFWLSFTVPLVVAYKFILNKTIITWSW